ncbi:MAG: YihY/virulence factor BrkB family protein [Nitrospira sp.]|nr:YihY/virulence factor BrkB family protein [Nitrospira sp.]MDH4368246.1 YihY/virulence factor BrkB family protein [Nitrospira sp.]MDH5348220.1 YihY/virulence factor BrkB family protein [Nitrospira sp.]MDH5495846.1 YihY/virulence factor BrkB family protein [Nitrospira sp.]MDH5726846.1 YihY/virulence factor BrkB family protein [Nitrospira sp.]
MSVLRFLLDALRAFLRQGCPSLAAALAFFSLLSLFPLVFLLLYGISFLVSQDIIGEQFMLSFLKGFLPSLGERLAEELHRISVLESVRWLVFLSFFWFGGLVFYELDYALNVVFKSAQKRHPLISTAVSIALLGSTGLLLFISYVATQAITFLTTYAPRLWGLDLVALAAHDFHLTYTLPFALAFLAVSLLYRLVPRRSPRWRDAMAGALTFGVLWVSTKVLFLSYGSYATVYVRLYGSLLEVVLLLLWVYYSAGLLLFGGVIAHKLQQLARISRSTSADQIS